MRRYAAAVGMAFAGTALFFVVRDLASDKSRISAVRFGELEIHVESASANPDSAPRASQHVEPLRARIFDVDRPGGTIRLARNGTRLEATGTALTSVVCRFRPAPPTVAGAPFQFNPQLEPSRFMYLA